MQQNQAYIDQRNVIAREDFTPFGSVMAGSEQANNTNSFGNRFTGHERDEQKYLSPLSNQGLDYMLARNYDPVLGRFLSVDPLADKYPSHSPYNYVLNNPLIMIDPDGKAPDDYYIYKNEEGSYETVIQKSRGLDTYHEVTENGDTGEFETRELDPNNKSDMNFIKQAINSNDHLYNNILARASSSSTKNLVAGRVAGAVAGKQLRIGVAESIDTSLEIIEGVSGDVATYSLMASAIPGVGVVFAPIAAAATVTNGVFGGIRDISHGNVAQGSFRVAISVGTVGIGKKLADTLPLGPNGGPAGGQIVDVLTGTWGEIMTRTVDYGFENHREF